MNLTITRSIIAPTKAVKIDQNNPPIPIPNALNRNPPINAPIMPTNKSPIRPKAMPGTIISASQPAINPTNRKIRMLMKSAIISFTHSFIKTNSV